MSRPEIVTTIEDQASSSGTNSRSIFWKYFDYDESTKESTCKECKTKVKSGKFTTDLKQHLEKHHVQLPKECVGAHPKKRKREEPSQMPITQVSIVLRQLSSVTF